MTAIALNPALPASRASRAIWAGRALPGLAILFLAMDEGGKLIAPDVMIANSPPLGPPADPGLGAVLLTGFLGGAVAVNVRVEMPLVTNTLFGIYVGAVVWGGRLLRDPRGRALLAVAA